MDDERWVLVHELRMALGLRATHERNPGDWATLIERVRALAAARDQAARAAGARLHGDRWSLDGGWSEAPLMDLLSQALRRAHDDGLATGRTEVKNG